MRCMSRIEVVGISLGPGAGPGNFWYMQAEVRKAMDGNTFVGLRDKRGFEWVYLLAGPILLYEALTYREYRGQGCNKSLK